MPLALLLSCVCGTAVGVAMYAALCYLMAGRVSAGDATFMLARMALVTAPAIALATQCFFVSNRRGGGRATPRFAPHAGIAVAAAVATLPLWSYGLPGTTLTSVGWLFGRIGLLAVACVAPQALVATAVFRRLYRRSAPPLG